MKRQEAPQNTRKLWPLLYGVIVLLAVGNIATLWYFTTHVEAGAPVENSLIDPLRRFARQEDLIINIQPLRDELNRYEEDPNISIYFEYLKTGANIVISKDAEFYPASLLKVPIAMGVAKKIESGKWKWTNELVLMPPDKDDSFGDLYEEKAGSTYTIDWLVQKMLVDSDNTASNILLRNLEPDEFRDVYQHLGFDEFFSQDGKISAKKYGVIYRSLYTSAYLSEEHSEKILQFLARTSFKEYIQAGLPDSVTFSHKIGISKREQVYLDAGIVYEPRRPYLLVVMIKTPDETYAQQQMAAISKSVHDYISSYQES